MKKIIVALKIVIFAILFIAVGKLFRFILVDDTASYTRVMMHELYNTEENIDVLFVGSSHCYFSFDPMITDEIFGKNTFNAGSASQEMDASFELIREVNEENDLEEVYLEMYYRMGDGGMYKDRNLMLGTNIISDYLKPSLHKWKFLLNASGKEHYVNSFIVARRDWEKLYDPDAICDLVQKKMTDDYKNYEYTYLGNEAESYQGKGYVENDGIAPEYYYFQSWPIYVDGFSQDWEASLKDIIEYCEKENIKLTLVSAPMPNFTLAGMGNYDTYPEKVYEIIEGTDVKYYDFNFCKENYFPNTSALFRDADHLNKEGAQLFSTLFAQFFTGQIPESELFYESFEEKLEHLEPMVLGMGYQDRVSASGEEIVRHMRVVSTEEEGMEYRIIMTPQDGEQYMVQDFDENKEFELRLNEKGICTVVSRETDDPDNTVKTMEIQY